MQGFVLRLPPQNKAHATFMQPLQKEEPIDLVFHRSMTWLRLPPQNKAHATFMQPLPVWQHASTHMAKPDDNNHAAIPMRSATTESRNA